MAVFYSICKKTLNFVAEKLGAEITRAMTQSSSKFLSCIEEICLDLFKFIDFETFVGDMIRCESFDHLLLTHVC
jgi:hypothetical protein